MSELLSQEEIDDLLKQLELATILPSIIEIKPSEIANVKDLIEREKLQVQFNSVNELYVKPLERLINFMNSRSSSLKYTYGFSDASILERLHILERDLLVRGYTKEQVINLVPQNTEEVSIILNARKNGFKDNLVVDNQARLNEAKTYLTNEIEMPKPKM